MTRSLSPLRLKPVQQHRSGVVLLVVLGMLTLFSVLAVSYLVFTSRNLSSASNINRSETARVDTKALVERSLEKVLVGSNGPDSALWSHDVIGDLYGSRDAVEGVVTAPGNYPNQNIDCVPEVLMGGQFLRFPTNLHVAATLPYRRNDQQVERRYPGYPGGFQPIPPATRFPVDDMLNGRLLTFTDGPLENLTFPIVRSFGDHRNVPQEGREALSGQVVIDLRDHLNSSVEIDGESRSIQEWLDFGLSPSRLIYDAIVTAGHITGASNPPPAPYAGFYINGRIQNGMGLGWDLARTAHNTTSGTNFNLNEMVSTELNVTVVKDQTATSTPGTNEFPFRNRPYEVATSGILGVDLPVAYQGYYGLHRLAPDFNVQTQLQSFIADLPPGDVDEPYDAADYNNLWLSYFPDDLALGEPTPSFVRPALLNWIVNQQAGGALNSQTVQRLRNVLYAIQRSTLRPLPFQGDVKIPAALSNRSPGVLQLSYANFTGGNTSDGLVQPIDLNSTDPNYLTGRIISLARSLAGTDSDGDGVIDSWDVDNNGDGVVDSVWTDAGLALGQDGTGRLYKPLVSYMIEDLGGRVNVNRAGNLAQARNIINTNVTGGVQQNMPILRPMTNAANSPLTYAISDLPTGFGYGPAEIDLRALFVPGFAPASLADQLRFGPQRLLGDRLGTWSTTNGEVSSSISLTPNVYIAAGELVDPLTQNGNDWLGAIRDPLRTNLHDFRESQGIPTDTFGRMTVGVDLGGGIAIGRGGVAVRNAGASAGDTDDDPYEFSAHANTDPDAPFKYSELESLLRFDGFDRDLVSSRLIEMIDQYHSTPPTNRAQLDQVASLKRLLADSMTTHSNSTAIATGTLPSEWRSNAATITDLRSNTTTLAANAAVPPQHVLLESLSGADINTAAGGNANQRDQVRNAWLWALLPPELRAGGRLNLNRPFGNGVNDDDDNNDGVIGTNRIAINGLPPGPNPADVRPFADTTDDPAEVAAGEVHLRFDSNTGPSNTLWSSTRGDVTPAEPFANGRATFARHLYVLAMFLTRDANSGTDFVFPFDNTVTFSPLTANPLPIEDEYRAWKIAQWAVNVADFRDPDGIMTPFNYDPNPYDGWSVVDTATGPTYRTVWGMEYPELSLEESLAFHDRRVRDTDRDPSMGRVITNAGSRGPDTTADQYQIPIGSLFLELRNTRSPQPIRGQASDADPSANPMAFPSDLYRNIGTVTNPNWVLDLAREAPGNNPVWRIAITQFHDAMNRPESCPDFFLQPNGADEPLGTFATAPAFDRDTVTLDPTRPQFFGSVVPTPIDRVVWFTGRDPDTDDNGVVDFTVPSDSAAPGKIFYNRGGPALLSPGQIAVVAPRVDTALGTAQYSDGPGPTAPDNLVIDQDGVPLLNPDRFASKQRIQVLNGVGLYDFTGTNQSVLFDSLSSPVGNASAAPILSIIAQSNPPTAWTGPAEVTNRTIGLNISEPYEVLPAAVTSNPTANPPFVPRNYYRAPEERLSDLTNAGFVYGIDSWHNFDTTNGQLPDEPFDGLPGSELFDTLGVDGQRTGTRDHYKTAYLQRLADPTQAYNAQTNPYISVDYISLDLTVFNGSQDNSESQSDAMGVYWPDPVDTDPYGTPPSERFASRYKTGMPVHLNLTTAPNGPANLTHSVNTFSPIVTTEQAVVVPPAVGTAVDYFRVELNIGMDVNASPNPLTARIAHSTSLGWANQAYGQRWQQAAANATMTPFVGLPFDSWLSNVSWLNRQFVSPEELMWVPSSGPGRFAFEFGTAALGAGYPAGADPFDDSNNEIAAAAPADQRRYDYNQQFTHLFNYLSSNANVFGGTNSSPNFWRLLEWVEVPPPFDVDADFVSPESDIQTSGENTVLAQSFNYTSFYNSTPPNSYIDANPLTWNFASRLSGSRNYNAGTWSAATPPGSGSANGFWTNEVSMEHHRPPFSFRSKTFRDGTINLNTIKNNRVYRALMNGFSTNAERTAQGAFWAAYHTSRRGYALPLPAAGGNTVRLRPNLNENSPSQFAGVFRPSNSADISPQISTSPTVVPIDSTRYRQDPNTPGQPMLTRPASLSQAQSLERSVVHRQLGQTRLANMASETSNVYAIWITVGLFEVDGTTLTVGQELGSDSGEVQRAKGFFIIDRSVPVMYQPGELNNVLNTVKLSRIGE
ncbi:MAG: hypothetical protein AB8B91_11225 [Rubripirellula sp.]